MRNACRALDPQCSCGCLLDTTEKKGEIKEKIKMVRHAGRAKRSSVSVAGEKKEKRKEKEKKMTLEHALYRLHSL